MKNVNELVLFNNFAKGKKISIFFYFLEETVKGIVIDVYLRLLTNVLRYNSSFNKSRHADKKINYIECLELF